MRLDVGPYRLFQYIFFFPVKLSIGRQFQSEAREKESNNRLLGAQPFYICSSKARLVRPVLVSLLVLRCSLSLWVYDKLGWGGVSGGVHYNSNNNVVRTSVFSYLT